MPQTSDQSFGILSGNLPSIPSLTSFSPMTIKDCLLHKGLTLSEKAQQLQESITKQSAGVQLYA